MSSDICPAIAFVVFIFIIAPMMIYNGYYHGEKHCEDSCIDMKKNVCEFYYNSTVKNLEYPGSCTQTTCVDSVGRIRNMPHINFCKSRAQIREASS